MSYALLPVICAVLWAGVMLFVCGAQLWRGEAPTPTERRFFGRAGLFGLSLVLAAVGSLVALTLFRIGRADIPNSLSGVQWTIVTFQLGGCIVAVRLWIGHRYGRAVSLIAVAVCAPPLVMFWWMFVVALPFLVGALGLCAHLAADRPQTVSSSGTARNRV